MEFATSMDGSGGEIIFAFFLQENLSLTKVGASMESATCPDFQLSGSAVSAKETCHGSMQNLYR